MRTLLDRLKPAFTEALELERQQFPHSVDSITKRLSSYEYVCDMPYGLIADISFFLPKHVYLDDKIRMNPYILFEE